MFEVHGFKILAVCIFLYALWTFLQPKVSRVVQDYQERSRPVIKAGEEAGWVKFTLTSLTTDEDRVQQARLRQQERFQQQMDEQRKVGWIPGDAE